MRCPRRRPVSCRTACGGPSPRRPSPRWAAAARAPRPNTAYVQIGSLAGVEASLPADLLRSRRIRITGSGAGSVSHEEMLAEAPEVMARFADGSLHLPCTAFPLSRVGEAWARTGRSRAVVVPD